MTETAAYLSQLSYDVRCEWGVPGVTALALHCDVIVIVDVLSFTTSVEIATARGATVFPYRWRDGTAAGFATRHGALLAGENEQGYTLRPASLVDIEPDCRLVLPSPNGSTLSTLAQGAGGTHTVAGCLRNRSAVAEHAAEAGRRVGVIASGERWSDGSLRPCFEDQCGAGAIVDALPPDRSRSPEAAAAAAVFASVRDDLPRAIAACGSGREKQAWSQQRDVELAASLDASRCVPVLADGAYRRHAP